MTSVGYVVLAVLLVSVAAAPAESDLNTSTTTTETTKDVDTACTFINMGLKTLMKSVGVMAQDGRFIESGAVTLMNVLASSGLIPEQKIQKPLDQQAIEQAAKACESVLNDNFKDNCQRPMQITQCVYAEYDKVNATRSDLSTSTTTTEKTNDGDTVCDMPYMLNMVLKVMMQNVGVMAEDGRFIESGADNLMNLLANISLNPEQKPVMKPFDQQAKKQAAKACESVLNDNFKNDCHRPMQIAQCFYAEYDKIVTLKRRQSKAAAASFTCKKFDDKDPCHKSCWLTSFGVLDEAENYNDSNASDLVAITYPDLSAENIEKTVQACNSVTGNENVATGCERAAQITTCFGEQYSKITGKQI